MHSSTSQVEQVHLQSNECLNNYKAVLAENHVVESNNDSKLFLETFAEQRSQ